VAKIRRPLPGSFQTASRRFKRLHRKRKRKVLRPLLQLEVVWRIVSPPSLNPRTNPARLLQNRLLAVLATALLILRISRVPCKDPLRYPLPPELPRPQPPINTGHLASPTAAVVATTTTMTGSIIAAGTLR
jgi:hypothetical protein